MWAENDKTGFVSHCENNIGQVNADSVLGSYIAECALDESNHSFLDVGAWNGLGTTKVLVDNLKKRPQKDWVVFALEINTDKAKFVEQLYRDEKNVIALNAATCRVTVDDVDKHLINLQSLPLEEKHYLEVDMHNMKSVSIFADSYNIKDWDVVVLDGSLYTTYFDFIALRDHVNCFLLDDVNTLKCRKIMEEVRNDDRFLIVKESNDRNGCAMIKRRHNA